MRLTLPPLFLLPTLALAAAPPAPLGPEEKLVRAWILENADDPKSVAFASWGPHDLKAQVGMKAAHELVILTPYAGQVNAIRDALKGMGEGPLAAVRVRYRMKNKAGALELYDHLFAVGRGKAAAFNPNEYGDGWRAAWAKILAPRKKG